MNVHMKEDEWFSQMGWEKNPFTLEIYPDLFVGHEEKVSLLYRHINEGHKHMLITGPTGSGKTTLLRLLSKKYNVLYFPKPPLNEEELVSVFRTTLLKPSFFQRIAGDAELTLYNLADRFNCRYSGSPVLLLIDEVHETNVHVLEWLRALVDQIEGVTVILAGLPKFKTENLKQLESLSQRIVLHVELGPLTKDDVFTLIKKRISKVHGQGIDPFTLDTIEEICTRSGGFPREVLKLCDSLVHRAVERKLTIIDKSYFKQEPPSRRTTESYKDVQLTKKQEDIINLLLNESLTPAQITNKLNTKEYKSDAHALRAINNILMRLLDSNLVTRERHGKTYFYHPTPKFKIIKAET